MRYDEMNYDEMNDFVERLRKCADARDDITLFGVNYVVDGPVDLNKFRRSINSLVDVNSELIDINAELRDIIVALQICNDDEADSSDCPFYDDSRPNRCGLDNALRKYGLKR